VHQAQQTIFDLLVAASQVNGGEAHLVSLDRHGFIEVAMDGGMKKEPRGLQLVDIAGP
jgi:hypothetical protein